MKMNVTLRFTRLPHAEELDVNFKKGPKEISTSLFDFSIDESEMLYQGYYFQRIKSIEKRLVETYDRSFNIQYMNIEDEFHRHYVFNVHPTIDGCDTIYVAVRQDDQMHDTNVYAALVDASDRSIGVNYYTTADFKNLGVI